MRTNFPALTWPRLALLAIIVVAWLGRWEVKVGNIGQHPVAVRFDRWTGSVELLDRWDMD